MQFTVRLLVFGFLVSVMATGCAQKDQPEATSMTVVSAPIHSEIVSSTPNVQKVTFHSNSLGKDMKFNVYLPPDYVATEKYPVLYLYNGY
jgi:enterochelin esterase-like enzyme